LINLAQFLVQSKDILNTSMKNWLPDRGKTILDQEIQYRTQWG